MDKKQVLKEFLSKKLAEHNIEELDEQSLDILYQHIEMEECPPNESETYRSLKEEIDSEGKITWESFKLWNLSQISFNDMFKLLSKEAGIFAFNDNTAKVIYALWMLIIDYYPKLSRTFKGQDAEVLSVIARLPTKEFSAEELLTAYNETFGKKLPEDNLKRSLKLLEEALVIRVEDREKGHYMLREKIKNLVRDHKSKA